jgi:ubiquinone/menaquinone biosynthesis C-methylase UbiE
MIRSLLGFFFQLLYHQLAWMYDFVAATVSLGSWKGWVQSALPYLDGQILEIGYGPGHLQAALHERGRPVFGLDESPQMAHQASRRLWNKGFHPNLSQGYAQHLPFPHNVFDTVVATFPSEYIFNQHTLLEVRRVLVPGGKLIILPMAWITGTHPLERLAAWLFRITAEAPGKPNTISTAIQNQFTHAGFGVRSVVVKMKGSQVLVIIATSYSQP